MLLRIPPAHEVVPGTEYKGFSLLPPLDADDDVITELQSEQLMLIYPREILLHTKRHELSDYGIILPIGLAFALKKHPEAIPETFRAHQDGEPVKIITSTRMLSTIDGRLYLAYFYINEKGEVVTSFIAEKPWGSLCPSPAIPFA